MAPDLCQRKVRNEKSYRFPGKRQEKSHER
jgi:hypothetical protein